MKYLIILGDGMSDEPLATLGGKTCLEYARTPNLDALAPLSQVGLCKTVPQGLKPGSDVANMSVMGFDPEKYYTGRSPLEAVAMRVPLADDAVTLRCNLVTLSNDEPYENKIMLDYSAGDISTEEAGELIAYLKEHFDDDAFTLYAGTQYRHCLVVKRGKTGAILTPPHDISDKSVNGHLPQGVNSDAYCEIMKKSYALLKDHPVNIRRVAQGKNPANSVWLWGEGTKPALGNFENLRKKKGGVISAVDLIRGIGMLAGLKIIEVDGITGNYNTNFKGKANAACDELLSGLDFVYIHMEAPDECGHHGDYENKVKSIEKIDGAVISTVIERLKAAGEDFAILVCPDHPTPCATKTHTSNPVPYMLYSSKHVLSNGATRYTEAQAQATGEFMEQGYKLIEKLFALK